MPFRTLADDDIFISYTHHDASTYAVGLADELTKRKFSCFIDRLGSEPSKDLPTSLRRKIRGCAMLVVIGTDLAGTRGTIEDEIKEFLHTGRRLSIVPVDFDGAVYKARWYHLIEGIAPEAERSITALEDGNPSPSVVSRIEKQFSYARRNQRLRRVAVGTATMLALLVVASVGAAIYASNQLIISTQAKKAAEQARAEAVTARGEAEAAKKEAVIQRDATKVAKAVADSAKRDAEAQRDLAKLATGRAKDADKIARSAKAEADQEQAIADSLQFANQSQRALEQSSHLIPESVGLALEALKKFPTTEADSALRASMSKLPLRRRVQQYEGDILDAQLSPDGQHLAILTSENVLKIYRSGDQNPLREFACRNRTTTSQDLRRQLVTLSSDAAYAAVISGIEAIVVDLKNDRSHQIPLVEEGFSIRKIAMSPNGKYIALAYWRRNPRFSGARVIDADNGRVVWSFADDLDSVGTISFGPEGDLVVDGTKRVSRGNTSDNRVTGIVRRVIAWPLSAKLAGRETGAELTSEDFGRGNVMRLPSAAPGEFTIVLNDSVAVGPNYSIIAMGSLVYQLTAEGDYIPMMYIPHTDTTGGITTSERRYAFSREGTQAITLTAKKYPSLAEWQLSALVSQTDEKLKSLARSSRSSWSLEWWELGDYAPRISQTQSILRLKFQPDNLGIRIMQGTHLPVRCFKKTDGQESKLIEVEQPQMLNSILGVSPNFDFMVTTDTKIGSVVKACGSKNISIPFPSDLKELRHAATTSDMRFLALLGSSGNSSEEFAVDVYTSSGNQYERWKRVQLSLRPLGFSLSSNGQYLNVSTDKGFKLWDVRNARELMIPGLEGEAIESMWLSPDAQFLVAFDVDGPASASTRILRLEDRTQIAISNYLWRPGQFPPQIFFSPSGRVFLEVGFGGTRLVDLKTGRAVRLLDSIFFAPDVAFSADDSYLAIATQDRGAFIYRTDNIKRGAIARLQPKGAIIGLAISPDNRYVATANWGKSNPAGGYGYVLRLWPLQPDDLIREATERLSIIPKSDH